MIDILGTLDEKIENNNKKAEYYEQLMSQYFVLMLAEQNENWEESTLTKIAIYTNGLAMQKYRPVGEEFLPVIKIKELSQGKPDSNSEKATPYLDERFIVNNGDIIFSWSGTLMVKIWCGGKGGLNQHLFKVTSSRYEPWFIYLWTKFHLEQFQNIAKGKAVTMGHIKREDLDKSSVYIPSSNAMEKYHSLISPLYKGIVETQIENLKLNELKQLYLKKFFG